MNIEHLANGNVRLTAANGVIDTRNGVRYSEVVCKEANVKYFKEA